MKIYLVIHVFNSVFVCAFKKKKDAKKYASKANDDWISRYYVKKITVK